MKRIFDEVLIKKYIEKHQLQKRFDEEMLAIVQLHEYEKGEAIYVSGTTAEYFYLVMEGRVKVSYPFENGKSMLMKFYTGAGTLGDIEFSRNVPICCNVDAANRVRMLAFPMKVLREQYMNNVKLLQFLADGLSIKLQATINNTSYNSVYPLANRVASYLVSHLDEKGDVHLNATYTEIAEFLGTTYRHLSRTLNELEADSIIQTEGKLIKVLEVEDLRELSKNPYQQSL